MQLENLLQGKDLRHDAKIIVKRVLEDAYQLSDIISSLLLLSKIEDAPGGIEFQKVRLDEVIFKMASRISKMPPDFKLQFEIENQTNDDVTIEVKGDEALIEIAIANLLTNAYAYSYNQVVRCTLTQEKDTLQLAMINKGDVPSQADLETLFNTFTRGSNVKNKPGSGIGLSIVQRILHFHQASIVYSVPDGNTNQILITYPRNSI